MKFLLRVGEIVLKKKNRRFFERILEENLRKKLGKEIVRLKNLGGVYFLETKSDLKEKLSEIFGLQSFSKVEVFNSLDEVLENLKNKNLPKNFFIEVQRGDKDFPLNSLEIRNKIKNFLFQEKKLVYNPQNFEIKIYLYYKAKKFFIFYEKEEGAGGLPVGSSGKAISLLSNGFDSPVASYLAMKRGLKIYFLHFHSYPQTSFESLEKVKKLVEVLNRFNLGSELYLINILEIQKFYFLNIPSQFLVIFYRRTMMRLAEKLKNEIKADVLITGENLGQVASQTIKNLEVINQAVSSLILRPLITYDKKEIINLARKIKTEEISRLKGDDCCSLFLPRQVETKADLKKILEIEQKIEEKIKSLEEKAFKNKEKLVYN